MTNQISLWPVFADIKVRYYSVRSFPDVDKGVISVRYFGKYPTYLFIFIIFMGRVGGCATQLLLFFFFRKK